MKAQSQMTRKRAREVRVDARYETMSVLRMHKMGATVSLGALATVAVVSAGGLFAAVLIKPSVTEAITHDFMLVAIGSAAWLFCLHLLWRCYRSELENVRRLLGQLIQLDAGWELLTMERRAHKNREPSGQLTKQERQVRRRKIQERNSGAHNDGFNNILQFESYKST